MPEKCTLTFLQHHMKIVYFYQYFSTPKGSWGTRVYEFAKDWVAKGHEVTVVTSVYYKSDIKAEGLIDRQNFEGIDVRIINVEINNKQPVLKRIWTFLQYGVLSSWYALTLPADVVIASSGPITVGLPGLVARYLRGRKLVFETRDLWPDGAIELGIINNPTVKKFSYWFEGFCYRASRLIVTLSPGMKEDIERRHQHPFVISVPNSANSELFGKPVPNFVMPDFAQGKKVAIYTGNIGMVNNSTLLFEAARLLKAQGRHDLLILLVGDGQQRDEFANKAAAEGLENFKILGLMPKKDLVGLVQNAMVSLVPLKGTPVLDTSSPNKLFESLAAGVPVIQTTQGWIKKFLKEENCGITIDADSPQELADALIQMADNPAETQAMGQKAFSIAENMFGRDFLAASMLGALEKVHQQ